MPKPREDYKPKGKDAEYQVINFGQKLEFFEPTAEEPRPYVQGYAAIFDVETRDSRSVMLDKGAFNKTISDGGDVKVLYQHDSYSILARKKNGTLVDLYEDDKGLFFKAFFDMETTLGRDAYQNVKSGLTPDMSFGGWAKKVDYNKKEKVAVYKEFRLDEVSIVTDGAFAQPHVDAFKQLDVTIDGADTEPLNHSTEEPEKHSEDNHSELLKMEFKQMQVKKELAELEATLYE